MSQRRQRLYRRLDRAERAAIERGLDKNRPARAMARDLGRSQSSVADEVRRNRTVARGPGKGSRVESVPEGACARLRGWPHVCNGCNRRRYHCSMPFRCEYSAARAQLLADGELSAARRGVDRTEEEFESIAAKIRADLARGLSPAQIADARSSEFRAAPSTIYRWIERGYAGMSNMDLRRKVGYRPRRRAAPAPTPHGPERSFSAFSALPEGEREAACEMDTVIGRAADRQCVLTLHLRCCRAQLCLLLPERSSSAVAAALDVLEAAVGKRAFQRMFGLILTDVTANVFSTIYTNDPQPFAPTGSRRLRQRIPAAFGASLQPLQERARLAREGPLGTRVVEVGAEHVDAYARAGLGLAGAQGPARHLPAVELRERRRHGELRVPVERRQPLQRIGHPHSCSFPAAPGAALLSAGRSFSL